MKGLEMFDFRRIEDFGREEILRSLSYSLNPFPFPSLPLRVLPTSSSIIKAIEPTLSSILRLILGH